MGTCGNDFTEERCFAFKKIKISLHLSMNSTLFHFNSHQTLEASYGQRSIDGLFKLKPVWILKIMERKLTGIFIVVTNNIANKSVVVVVVVV